MKTVFDWLLIAVFLILIVEGILFAIKPNDK